MFSNRNAFCYSIPCSAIYACYLFKVSSALSTLSSKEQPKIIDFVTLKSAHSKFFVSIYG